MTGHLLLHYSKTSMLWQFIFSLFEVVWVMYSSSRRTFWVGMALLWGRNEKRPRGLHPCACFGLFGGKGTRRLLTMLGNQTQFYAYFCELDQDVHRRPLNFDKFCKLVDFQVRRRIFFFFLAQISHLLCTSFVHWYASFQALLIYILICP